MKSDRVSSPPVTLQIRHGTSRPAEHLYILEVLLGEHLGLRYHVESIDGLDGVEIRCPEVLPGRVLWVAANLLIRPTSQWLTEASLPALPLTRWDPRSVLPTWKWDPLPVLYPPLPSALAGQTAANALVLPLDLFGGAFFLLTRYEELVAKQRDKHQRFPGSLSVAYKAGFILEPLVDLYAELLRVSLEACFPGLYCRRPQPQIRLSHDVDHPFQFFGQPLGRMFLSAGKRLYHQPRFGAAWQLLQAAIGAGLAGKISADPFNRFKELMAASEALGTPAEFYFMTAVTNSRYDEPYDLLRPELQDVLRQIHSRGHIIGLHGSYESFRSETTLRQELATLRKDAQNAGIELDSVGGRQHYLRWESPGTWRSWDQAGLNYDATLGFPDHVGFRCGTAHEFPVFDLIESRKLRLRERPLVAMDVTLTDYMNLSLTGSASTLANLWAVTRQVGGTLEILIHNCNPLAGWLAKSVVELNAAPASR
jgi:hypothetical protein